MRLETGSPAPPFRGTDDAGNEVSLDDFTGKQLVIYFYPKAFTPGCTTESCDFRDRYERFVAAGYAIIGVSPDTPEKLASFRSEHALPFALLSDPDHEMAEAYGAWGEKKLYGKSFLGIIRKTFIINEDGYVEKIIEKVKTKEHSKQIFAELSH